VDYVQFFECDDVTALNKEVSLFCRQHKVSVVNVKLAVNQSTHKPLYSKIVAAIIFREVE
jgi:hypothetical protein